MTVSEIHSQFRQAFNIVLCSTWLSECVSFLQTQTTHSIDIADRVYEQFLYSDLKASLVTQPTTSQTTLSSDLILQVVDWIDVSLSISAQIENEHDRLQDHARRIIAIDDEDSHIHATGNTTQSTISLAPSSLPPGSASKKRLLKIWLSNGHTTLLAMEAASLCQILDAASLSLGYKLRVKSGTPIAHDTLLLTPERVECLGGGFVEEPTDCSLLKRLESRLENLKSKQSTATLRSGPGSGPGSRSRLGPDRGIDTGLKSKRTPRAMTSSSASKPEIISIDGEEDDLNNMDPPHGFHEQDLPWSDEEQ